LGDPNNLHPMQAAFINTMATSVLLYPWQICSAVAVLDEIKAGMPSHVKATCSPN